MIRIPLWMPLPGKEVRYPGVGPAYVALVPQLALIAKQNGYAFAVHGSMGRDLDLIAIPLGRAVPDVRDLRAVSRAVRR